MSAKLELKRALAAVLAGAALSVSAPALAAQGGGVVAVSDSVHAGELDVPINKSQVLRSDRPYAKALIGNPDIADILPLTNQSILLPDGGGGALRAGLGVGRGADRVTVTGAPGVTTGRATPRMTL